MIRSELMMGSERVEPDPRVLALLRVVEDDLGRPWSVPEMAAVLGISAGQLRRIAKESLGATPRQWLCNLRLERAAHLLSDTSLRIKEVQTRVGLADASHFARDFRDRFGTSPTEYRWRAPQAAAKAGGSHDGSSR